MGSEESMITRIEIEISDRVDDGGEEEGDGGGEASSPPSPLDG